MKKRGNKTMVNPNSCLSLLFSSEARPFLAGQQCGQWRNRYGTLTIHMLFLHKCNAINNQPHLTTTLLVAFFLFASRGVCMNDEQ